MRGEENFYNQNVHLVHCGSKNFLQQSRWSDFRLSGICELREVMI